jgi:hypothetical protein
MKIKIKTIKLFQYDKEFKGYDWCFIPFDLSFVNVCNYFGTRDWDIVLTILNIQIRLEKNEKLNT